MRRISVTALEPYRYWKASEDRPLSDFLADLRHEKPATPQMMAGRAFGKLFEYARDGEVLSIHTLDGWTFDFRELDGHIVWPATRELKVTRLFDTPSGPVTLVGQCDAVAGKVRDLKLTERLDAEKYIDSWQWRAYLLMFGAREFVYDVFQGSYGPRNVVQITNYLSMSFYAYPEMERDVQGIVNEVAAIAYEHLAPPE